MKMKNLKKLGKVRK